MRTRKPESQKEGHTMLLESYFNVRQFIRKEIHAEFNPQQESIFLVVCMNDGITQPEICEALDMPQGTVSRNILRLSDNYVKDPRTGAYKQVGYGLVDSRQDEVIDSRRRSVFLTKKGKAIKARLEELLASK